MVSQTLITYVVPVILFSIAAYGLKWCCDNYKAPVPIYWLVGGIMIIVILLWIARVLGV